MEDQAHSETTETPEFLSPERITALKERGCSAYKLGKAQRLRSNVIQALHLLEEESSIKARQNLDDAEERYARYMDDLEAEYAPAADGAAGEHFANRREAWQWLRDNGYEASESTFYRNIGRPGYPALLPGKRLSRWECSEFLRRQMVDGAATPQGGVYDPDDLVQRKLVADTQKAEADAGIARSKQLRLEREADREWVRRVDAYALAAALIGRLRDAVLHHLRHGALRLAQSVHGDTERAPELYEAAAACVATAFNEVEREPLDVTLLDSAPDTDTPEDTEDGDTEPAP